MEFVRLDITSRCNFNCKICYGDIKPREKELPVQKWIEVIKEIKELEISRVILSGGEPFIRKSVLKELVSICEKLGIDCEIVTNGSLIEEEDCEWLKNCFIWISLDGHNEEINSLHRQKGSFRKILNTVNLLKSKKISFGLITCLSKANVKYLEEIIKFGMKLGTEYHSFTQFLPIGRGAKYKELYISPEEWIDVVKTLEKYDHCLFDHKHFEKDCYAGKKYVCIEANGNVKPCTKCRVSIGNILNQSLHSILRSEKLEELNKIQKWDCLSCPLLKK